MLRDAFISWDEEQELDWAVRYWQQARQAGLPLDADFGEFWRQLEWMGLQRHLKVLGIFCRLKHRDAKPAYSQDLPRFFRYARRAAGRYNGLGALLHLLDHSKASSRRSATRPDRSAFDPSRRAAAPGVDCGLRSRQRGCLCPARRQPLAQRREHGVLLGFVEDLVEQRREGLRPHHVRRRRGSERGAARRGDAAVAARPQQRVSAPSSAAHGCARTRRRRE